MRYIVYGGQRGGGKIFHLEQRIAQMHKQLEEAREEIARLEKNLAAERIEKVKWARTAEWLIHLMKLKNEKL